MKDTSINFLRPSGEIYHRKGIWKYLPLWMFSLSIKFRKPDEIHEYKQPEFTLTVAGTRNDFETMYKSDHDIQWKPVESIYLADPGVGFFKVIKNKRP